MMQIAPGRSKSLSEFGAALLVCAGALLLTSLALRGAAQENKHGAPGMASYQATIQVRDLAEESGSGDSSPTELPKAHHESVLRLSSLGSSNLSFAIPRLAASFLALPDTNDRTPPDTQGAVGRHHIMSTLNTSVRFQTRTGEQIRTVALSVFWSSLNYPDPFDPKCVYDPFQDRWIFIACANRLSTNSALLVGVSQTSDPTDKWNLYRFDGVGGGTNWIDYPSLGFNKDWIVVQARMKIVPGTEFAESQIYVFNKADLYGGGKGLYTLFRETGFGPTQAPAVTYDTNLATIYLVRSPVDRETHNHLKVFTITGAVGSEALQEFKTFETRESWQPQAPGQGNFAPQLGSTNKIHLQDASIQNVVYRNGSLWCAHHIFLPSAEPTRSAIQWWQLSTNEVLQRGRIDDPNGTLFYAYPSIAVNKSNDVLIGYSRFASNQYASANYAIRLSGDPPNTFRGDTVLKAGEGPYWKTRQTGKNRWGDFSATMVDPSDDLSFWTIQEYAAAPNGDATLDDSGRWGTWWGKIEPALIDTDGDRLPDAWEEQYRLDPQSASDASIDRDGDRMSNLEEYCAGTDPSDPSSALRFTRVERSGSELILGFPTVAGKAYYVERKDNFVRSIWVSIAEVSGTGNTVRVADQNIGTRAQYFYRIRLAPRD